MSSLHGLQAFTDQLATEAASLFITYRRERLWLDWHVAHEFAFFASMVQHRKQGVKGVFVAGRWYWHVRALPVPLFGDGVDVSPAAAAVGVAASTPAPSSARCAYRRVTA